MPLGPCVWKRRHVWQAPQVLYESVERFYLIRTPEFKVDFSGHTELERRVMREYRWWALDDLRLAKNVLFAPARLHQYLAPLITGLVPSEPIDVGV